MKKIYVTIAVAMGLLLVGCQDPKPHGKVDNTPYKIESCLHDLSLGAEMTDPRPIDKIVVYKSKRELTTYHKGQKVDTFRISLGKNADKGNKIKAGDYKTPEGHYQIVRKKCDPRLYRSLMISYPNEADKKRAAQRGVDPGGYITIHGQPKWNADGHGDAYTLAHDWTEGCMAVPNRAMAKLWHSVQNGVEVVIYP
jgi:murein L,D-transpeptidase YafK